MDFDNSLDIISPDVASNTITIGGNGSLQIPSGTTGQRPGSSLTTGMIRWVTDGSTANTVEVYAGSSTWKSLQFQSTNLDNLSAMSTSGFVNRNGTTYTARSLTAPTAGLTITNNDGTAGNPTFALANDLAGVEGLSTTGIVVRTGDGTWTTRTLVAGTNVTLSNADGTAGDITINASGTGGGGSVAVSDEGSQLTATASSINFTGAGVTATTSTNAVTVNIPGTAPTTVSASKAGQFTLRTTVGSQSVTGLGFTPVAVIFYYTESVNNGVAQELRRTYGCATSATKRWTTTMAICTNNAWSGQQFVNNRIMKLYEVNADTVLFEADFLTMDYDGFTIDVSITSAGTRNINYIAIGGDGVVAAAGWWTLAGTAMSGTTVSAAASVGGNQAIAGLGFQPKITMFGWVNAFNGGSVFTSYNHFNYGWAMSSTKQFAITQFMNSDVVPVKTYQHSRYGSAFHQWISNAGVNDRASFVSNDVNGFTVTWAAATGSFDYYMGYLSIGGAISVDIANITEPGTTGNTATTGLSFTPNLGIFASMGSATADWTDGTSPMLDVQFGLGAATSTTSRWTSAFFADDNNSATTNPGHTTSTTKALVLAGTTAGTTIAEADLASFDATGYTLNWSKVDGVGSKIFAVTMGANTATRGLAGGNTNTIQYNNGSALAGDDGLTYDPSTDTLGINASNSSILMTARSTDVSAPAAGTGSIYNKTFALGKVAPVFMGYPFTKVADVEPGLLGNIRTAAWLPGTNAAQSGWGFNTTLANTSNPAMASTSFKTRNRRFVVGSTGTAGTIGYIRSQNTECWRGNSAGVGGFYLLFQFAIESQASGNRGFIGLTDNVGANPTNVDILAAGTTTPGRIGLGYNANTGNLQLNYCTSGSAPTVVDLGANFPNSNATNVYEFVLYSPPNGSGIQYSLSVINPGTSVTPATGTVTTNIPTQATFLSPLVWATNNATATAATIALYKVYLETMMN